MTEANTSLSRRYALPATTVGLRDYHDKLIKVLGDVSIPIYLDANILSWMLRVGSGARREFYEWCEGSPNRVRVPVWAAHEFYRLLREKKPYNDACNALNQQQAALQSLIAELTFQIDQQRCGGDPIVFLSEALAELKSAWNRVAAITKDKAWYGTAESSVVQFVNARVLDDDVFEVFAKCITLVDQRLAARIPPGYNDQGKGENRIGDFVFWKEILQDAAKLEAKHVIILTDDNKPDWSFAPSNIQSYANKDVGSDPLDGISARIPHPMLLHEARLANIGDITILNPPLFAFGLDLIDPAAVKALLGATHPPRLAAKVPLVGPDKAKIDPPLKTQKVEVADDAPAAEPELALSIEDIVAALREQTDPVEQVEVDLSGLKGDATARVEAFSRLTDPNFLEPLTRSVISRIGRNVYRAAIEDDRIAAMLRASVKELQQSSAADANMLLAGMWAELYLDEDLRSRSVPAGGPFEVLFDLDEQERLKSSGAAVMSIMDAQAFRLLARPGSGEPELETKVIATRVFDGAVKNLEQVTVGDVPLLCEVPPGFKASLAMLHGDDEVSLDELLLFIARRFVIPRPWLKPEVEQIRLALPPELGVRILRLDQGGVVDPPFDDSSTE